MAHGHQQGPREEHHGCPQIGLRLITKGPDEIEEQGVGTRPQQAKQKQQASLKLIRAIVVRQSGPPQTGHHCFVFSNKQGAPIGRRPLIHMIRLSTSGIYILISLLFWIFAFLVLFDFNLLGPMKPSLA
jgi:hypothetical protein